MFGSRVFSDTWTELADSLPAIADNQLKTTVQGANEFAFCPKLLRCR